MYGCVLAISGLNSDSLLVQQPSNKEDKFHKDHPLCFALAHTLATEEDVPAEGAGLLVRKWQVRATGMICERRVQLQQV